MATLAVRRALWQQGIRSISVILLASLSLGAGPVLAQTTETTCPPEPVFGENGQLDKAGYQARLEQCLRQERQQRLHQVQQELALTATSSLAAEEGAVLEQDSLALVALYNSTNGPNWIDNTNWLTGPVSTWFGVTVREGRVTELKLVENGLEGTLPPELGDLTSLYVLDLWNNERISGAIPPELGNLTNLQDLDLALNQLTGNIPHELSNLASLQQLHLYANKLTGTIPPELGNLANLQQLNLRDNQLTGNIPPDLGNLTNLRMLDVQLNLLRNIPPELGNLASLAYLDLGYNGFSSIPPELGNLASLEHLDLSINGIVSIPPELGNLSNLRTLILGDNNLTGSIPPELGNLANLRSLGLANNYQLTGSIPPELGNLSNLRTLSLSDNQLTGSIPPELGNLVKLEYLGLSVNQLTGSIPPELGDLTELQSFALDDNQFSGSLPVTLVNLTNLNYFSFEGTNLCAPQDPAFIAWLQGIAYLRSSGLACEAPPLGTLAASWPLDGDGLDEIGSLKAILFGGPGFVPGVSGQALHFDGVDDYAAVENHPKLNPTAGLTLAAWFFCETGSGNATGLEKRRSYRLLSLQSGAPSARWVFDFWNEAGTYFRLTARTAMTNGAWHHVAATYDGSTVKLYLDGQLDKSERAWGAVRTTSGPFEMGRRDLSKYFKGQIDEVRLYEGALSAEEVQALYADGSAAAALAPALSAALEEVPTEYVLEGNYPNPFNPTTEIRFGLPEAAEVQLVVYDVTGREVAHLAEGPLPAGYHVVRWEAASMPSGVYLYRLVAGAFSQARTMVLVK